MKKKEKKNPFFRILGALFLMFMCLYFILESGYYEAKISKKTAMTEESIKQFENDIKNGLPIDINSYTFKENTDYSNNTTDTAIFIGEKVESFMSGGITEIFNIVKSLFT